MSFKIRVVMKALENNRNIAKPARGKNAQKTGWWARTKLIVGPMVLPICAGVPPISSVCI